MGEGEDDDDDDDDDDSDDDDNWPDDVVALTLLVTSAMRGVHGSS